MVGEPVRAAVLESARALTIREFPRPSIGEDDALLRVEACGLCGTDHEYWSGTMQAPLPMVPGHETVGVIDEIGERAAARWGVGVGDRVAVEVFQSCRRCTACRRGDVRGCEQHGLRDPYGVTTAERSPSLWGGYAQYQYLAPDTLLQRVPDGLDPQVAAAFNAVGGGYRWMVRGGGVASGDRVAVLGPGIRGIAACAAAKDAGAAFVMMTGAGPGDHARLDAAKRFGADLVVDVLEQDPVEAFIAATGGLADIVLDVTARSASALVQALALARFQGTVVLAGTRGDTDVPGFRSDVIVTKELRVQGMMGVDSRDFRAAIDLLASGRFPFAELPRMTADLDGANELLATMAGERDGAPPLFGVIVP